MIIVISVVLGLGIAYVIAHLALIEIGREVVILYKPTPNGDLRETRLWIVDDGGLAWLHHANAESFWLHHLDVDPILEIRRDGELRRYRAGPDLESHDEVHVLLREKYSLADRWVRFVLGGNEECAAVPIRLELL